MLNTVVKDYEIVVDIPSVTHTFNGNSIGAKDILKLVFADKAPTRTVLDIGFGVGDLGRILKTDARTKHWQVDGIDGFDQTCQNVELFRKGWYRNIWHGLAQDIEPQALAAYDVLCLFDVIEHLDAVNAKQLLKTLLESLGPDSKLALSTPLWFYPQDHNNAGDLEEHLIGVPARSMLALQPSMFVVSRQFLVGTFVFTKASLKHIDQFQPTADRGFDLHQGLAQLQALGGQADGNLYRTNFTHANEVHVGAATPDPAYLPPAAHAGANAELLTLIPGVSQRLVEVGCSGGALAAASRQARPEAHYVGVEADAGLATAAAAHCSAAVHADIEAMDEAAFAQLLPADCWIFSDSLAHLRDPWRVLRRVRALAGEQTRLVVSLPNAQHWSVQKALMGGEFRPTDSGLLDRRQLRWFTRLTMLEMFQQTGWQVEEGLSRTPAAPAGVLDALAHSAAALGLDAEAVKRDASPSQYLFRLRPA